MAKRVCGDVTIELYWRPGDIGLLRTRGYRCTVRCPGTTRGVFFSGFDPNLLKIVPNEMPLTEAYDHIAGMALLRAMEPKDEISRVLADGAASGIREGDYMVFRSRKDQRGPGGLGVAAKL